MNPDYYQKLVQGQIILETSEQGMPTWRSHGIETARRMEQTFYETVAADWKLTRVETPSLVGQDNFSDFYHDINPQYLESSYRIAGQNQLLRCDPFLACVPFIRDECLNQPGSVIGTTAPLFRFVAPKPLIVDRRIWPVVGIYAASCRESSLITMERLYFTFKKFYDQICLPTFFVYQEDYGNYARRMILPIAPIGSGELTVVATIFELSQLFSQKIGVSQSLFEAGISEKNLTVFYALQASRDHVTLPRRLSPVEVMILSDNGEGEEQLTNYLEEREIRYQQKVIDDNSRKSQAKAAEFKGVPLIIHLRQGKMASYWLSFSDQKGDLDNPEMTNDLLDKSDDDIRQFNRGILMGSLEDSTDNVISRFCPKCAEKKLTNYNCYGAIYPFQPTSCPECNSSSQLAYYLERETTGTIREKKQRERT